MVKYLIRFDDICPTMNWKVFYKFKSLLEEKNIKSILAVIPMNRDKKFNFNENKEFFKTLRKFKKYGDTIGQHGYTHEYLTKDPGILNINSASEFSGLTYEQQYKRLEQGKNVLINENIWDNIFIAPSHSYDDNTIKAAYELGFRIFSDGYGLYPYKYKNMIFVPQFNLLNFLINQFLNGFITICVHVNTINEKKIEKMLDFIEKNHSDFTNLQICLKNFKTEKFYQKTIRYIFTFFVPLYRQIFSIFRKKN
jgi:predicted deacetylase